MRWVFSTLSLFFLSIILAYSLGAFYAYFYPVKYYDLIVQYAQENDLDSALVASVINVESGYNSDALSSKGAIGLMQIMPSTGEWISSQIGEDFSQNEMFNPETNIKYGCFYLNYLLRYFGDEKLALCAYNAGQGNVVSWLKNEEYSKDGATLDKIPYKETQNYLSRVLKNRHYYKNKYK